MLSILRIYIYIIICSWLMCTVWPIDWMTIIQLNSARLQFMYEPVLDIIMNMSISSHYVHYKNNEKIWYKYIKTIRQNVYHFYSLTNL